MTKSRREIVYAFIDAQNLHLGVTKDLFTYHGKLKYHGWKLDMSKFRIYLKDKYRVSKAFIFIGYQASNQKLYDSLRRYGFELVFKPTVVNSKKQIKGNVDAELVLNAAKIEYDNYDLGVFVSGDGDFHCLYKYLVSQKKLKTLIIPNELSCSSLLKEFEKYKRYISMDRDKFELVGRRR